MNIEKILKICGCICVKCNKMKFNDEYSHLKELCEEYYGTFDYVSTILSRIYCCDISTLNCTFNNKNNTICVEYINTKYYTMYDNIEDQKRLYRLYSFDEILLIINSFSKENCDLMEIDFELLPILNITI